MKLTLRKIFGKSFLTFEELHPMLFETEYLINCRPLVYTSSDDTHETLTSFDLMYGRKLIDHKMKDKRNEFMRKLQW